MKNLFKSLLIVFGFSLFAPVVAFAEEAPPGVMEVIIIDGSSAGQPFVPFFDRFTEVYKKQGSAGERRLWANVWAGPNAGTAIVTIEYPNLAALGDDGKIVNSEAYQEVAQEFFGAGFRVASRSIVVNQR